MELTKDTLLAKQTRIRNNAVVTMRRLANTLLAKANDIEERSNITISDVQHDGEYALLMEMFGQHSMLKELLNGH